MNFYNFQCRELYTIEKIALNKTVNAGENVVFEVIVTNTGLVEITDLTVNEVSFDGLTYLSYEDTQLWLNEGLSWTLVNSLSPGQSVSLFVYFRTGVSGNLTNVVSSGNLSANDTVEVLPIENKTIDNKTDNSTVVENKTIENRTINDGNEVMHIPTSKETGNPIFLILLVLLNLVILRRRK